VGLRTVMMAMIGCLPTRRLRRALYCRVRHYDIDRRATIGWLSVIDVQRLSMARGARIGAACVLRGPMSVTIGEDASMGSRNVVQCADWFADFDDPRARFDRVFSLAARAMVTSEHFFDAIGGVYIGEGTWVAGRGSQVWTHGLGAEKKRVVVGRYCYLGSAVRLAPGAHLGDLTVVAMGAVVSNDFQDRTGVLLGGVPAHVVREDYRPPAWAALEEALDSGSVAYAVAPSNRGVDAQTNSMKRSVDRASESRDRSGADVLEGLP
jgi:acetyltransferase-like isoleucine patch superfamily enzyme